VKGETMFKKLGIAFSVVVLGGFLVVGAAQEVAPETEAPALEAPALPPPIDWRMAAGLAVSTLAGTGMTWLGRRKVKLRGPVNYGLSALFTMGSAAGYGVVSGMPWKDSALMGVMGWLTGQGVYKAAKNRAPQE